MLDCDILSTDYKVSICIFRGDVPDVQPTQMKLLELICNEVEGNFILSIEVQVSVRDADFTPVLNVGSSLPAT